MVDTSVPFVRSDMSKRAKKRAAEANDTEDWKRKHGTEPTQQERDGKVRTLLLEKDGDDVYHLQFLSAVRVMDALRALHEFGRFAEQDRSSSSRGRPALTAVRSR